MVENKPVVFDFDKTLTNYDTMLPFFLFCCKKELWRYFGIPVFIGLKVCSKLKWISIQTEKDWGIGLFCPKKNDTYQERCLAFSKEIRLNDIYTKNLKKHIQDGDRLIVISASLQDYLKPLFPCGVEVIGTQLTWNKGRIKKICTHPFREEKVKILREIGVNSIKTLYTDSQNDVFMANISSQVFWVKDGQINNDVL